MRSLVEICRPIFSDVAAALQKVSINLPAQG
jgi:hypothetical protein